MSKFKDEAIDIANAEKAAPKKAVTVDTVEGVAVLSSRQTDEGLIVVLEDGRKLLVGVDGKVK
jgi:hypothetical protein